MKKKIALFCSIIYLLSCKSNDTLVPNHPPNAFDVKTTLKSDGKTVVLNWTKANDPDGDVVTYAVILKDTLEKNINDTTYSIANLDYNFNQTGKIIAKDSKGLTAEASFVAKTKLVKYISILDPYFEQYLIFKKIDKDGIVNGTMNAYDAIGVDTLLMSNLPIKNLVGIEHFIDLRHLYCQYSNLESLDISKNIKLTHLGLYGGQLRKLDISQNTKLEHLICSYNQLANLDISKNVELKLLHCEYNQLTTLDISANQYLEALYCWNNQLTILDASKNLTITSLYCYRNQLKNLDVSKSINLKYLSCRENKLTSINVSNHVYLQYFECHSNQLDKLEINNSVNLEYLDCRLNRLVDLNLSKNLKLYSMLATQNQIKTICVPNLSITTNWWKDEETQYLICK